MLTSSTLCTDARSSAWSSGETRTERATLVRDLLAQRRVGLAQPAHEGRAAHLIQRRHRGGRHALDEVQAQHRAQGRIERRERDLGRALWVRAILPTQKDELAIVGVGE